MKSQIEQSRHWEGDLIIVLVAQRSARWLNAARASRCYSTFHDWWGYGESPRDNNAPSLSGQEAEVVRNVITRTIAALSEELRRSLT